MATYFPNLVKTYRIKSVNTQLGKYKEYTTKYIMAKLLQTTKRKPYNQPEKSTTLSHTGRKHYEKLPSSPLKQWNSGGHEVIFLLSDGSLHPVKGTLQKITEIKHFQVHSS